MPKLVRPLSEAKIKTAKPKDKQYKLFDGDGLFLTIYPNNIKRWSMNYSFVGKATTIAIGKYPEVSLKEAREKRQEIREKVRKGENPSKKAQKLKNKENPLEVISREYFEKREDLSESYKEDHIKKLEKDIFPKFGVLGMDMIGPMDMLSAIQAIDKRGSNVTAKKVFGIVDRIYRYAVTVGKAKRNIMNDLDKKVALRTVEVKNLAHTTDIKELADLLKAIDEYAGDYNTKMALKILPYVFVRPSNLRFMEWKEIDFKKKLWNIPGSKMKMKKDHVVPLANSVLKVIEEMKDVSYGVSVYVFPSRLYKTRGLSENTFNTALKRMGFEVTAHGFRHTASTLLHENISKHKIHSDAIEMQMAHTVGSSVKQVYNKALYIDERIELMQWWSDYLDELKISE